MEEFLTQGSDVADVVETPEAAQEAPTEEVVAEEVAAEAPVEEAPVEEAQEVEAPIVKVYEGKRVSFWENDTVTLETGEKMPLSLEDYQALPLS